MTKVAEWPLNLSVYISGRCVKCGYHSMVPYNTLRQVVRFILIDGFCGSGSLCENRRCSPLDLDIESTYHPFRTKQCFQPGSWKTGTLETVGATESKGNSYDEKTFPLHLLEDLEC